MDDDDDDDADGNDANLEASQSSVVASSANIRLNDWNQPDDDDDGFGKTNNDVDK